MAKHTAQPGDTVELAHKETGFFDPETEFQIVRDQRAKLGDKIGTATGQALVSGTLLIVGGAKPKDDAKPKGKAKSKDAEEE